MGEKFQADKKKYTKGAIITSLGQRNSFSITSHGGVWKLIHACALP